MEASAQAMAVDGRAGPAIPARVTGVRDETADTRTFEFAALSGAPLPGCTPGAHIDVELPNGLTRQYSLLHAAQELDVYSVAVKREPAGRGGSLCLHERVHVGDTLGVSAPRNHFALNEAASHCVLIAGGIGITPILCMAEYLHARGASWQMHYACRSAGHAAFLDRVRLYPQARFYSDADRRAPAPVAEIIATAPAGADLYCCGPAPMLDAFEQAAEARPDVRAHVERFSAAHAPATEGGFVVRLARSGRKIHVKQGQSILHALLEAGLDLPHSCEEGVCGTCETRVISGVPDHRDSLLSARERAANKVLMICCSGALSAELVLDL